MRLRLTRNQQLILILSIVMIFGLTYLSYMLFVSPKKTNIEQLETSIKTEQKLLDVLSQNEMDDTEPTYISSTEIQKKLPVIPLIEQLILELEKAETVSESRILTMSFSESDFSLTEQPNGAEGSLEDLTENNTLHSELNEENSLQKETNEQKNEQVASIDMDPQLVDGLKRITISLSVESPNYFELQKFLSAIEHQTRITKVDTLSFTGQPEIVSVEQEVGPLTYAITISSFYMPKFSELAAEAPAIETPPPANKKNPLATSLNIYNEENEKVEEKETIAAVEEEIKDKESIATVDHKSTDYHFINHKVKENETLYSISMKYYKSRKGEQLIRTYNNLQGNKILEGQVLKIPIKNK